MERRWYDKDPILKEALDLLQISCEETQAEAAHFMIKLQEQVAGEVIEHVYQIMNQYQGKGNRWYDQDPVVMKAIELLRIAPKETQRKAALKLLLALEEQSFDNKNLGSVEVIAEQEESSVAKTTPATEESSAQDEEQVETDDDEYYS